MDKIDQTESPFIFGIEIGFLSFEAPLITNRAERSDAARP
jgi:hypothetical protein